MAQVYKFTYTTYNAGREWASTDFIEPMFERFFRTWDCPFVEKVYRLDDGIIDLIIDKDTTVSFRYVYYGQVYAYINDERYCYMLEYSRTCDQWVAYSDNMFYYAFTDNRGSYFSYLYEIIDGVIYEGYSTTPNISDIVISERGNEESIKYTHTRFLKYNTAFKTVDYTYSMLFTQEDDKTVMTDNVDMNFMGCSNVSKDSVISFEGSNYYALDTNTLVMLDPIEKEDDEADE